MGLSRDGSESPFHSDCFVGFCFIYLGCRTIKKLNFLDHLLCPQIKITQKFEKRKNFDINFCNGIVQVFILEI